MPRDHRPAKSVRVLLAEDPGTPHGALALLLGMAAEIEVVARVERGEDIAPAALAARPDIALLDIGVPGRDALEAAVELRAEVPECRVIVLTPSARPGVPGRALAAGVAGLLVKDGPVEELIGAIRQVLTGETVIDPALAAAEAAAGGGAPGQGTGTTGTTGPACTPAAG